MYDSMALDGVSFSFYMNSSCGAQIGGAPCHSVGPKTDTSPVYGPDASLAGVVRHTKQFKSHEAFYEDAAAGNLSSFTWINAKEEACDHPCHDMAKGERAQKDIYEALRAGPGWNKPLLHAMLCYAMRCDAMPCHAMPCHTMPCHAMLCYAMLGWNKTLFFIAYDDAGGTYDHMVPPSEDVPDDESPCQAP